MVLTFTVHDDGPVGLDAVAVVFDDENMVSDAGIVLVATRCERLGIEALAGGFVRLTGRAGGANVGRKIMSLLYAMVLGADSIDDCDVLARRPHQGAARRPRRGAVERWGRPALLHVRACAPIGLLRRSNYIQTGQNPADKQCIQAKRPAADRAPRPHARPPGRDVPRVAPPPLRHQPHRTDRRSRGRASPARRRRARHPRPQRPGTGRLPLRALLRQRRLDHAEPPSRTTCSAGPRSSGYPPRPSASRARSADACSTCPAASLHRATLDPAPPGPLTLAERLRRRPQHLRALPAPA